MSQAECFNYLKLFESSEVEIFLKSVFNWCCSISAAVVGTLNRIKSQNAELHCEYRILRSKLKDLYYMVKSYIDKVGTPPDYDERLVLEELTSTDKKAVFDIKNKLRFPFTIDYLNILVIWLKDVKEKLEQVNALYMQLCSELKTATVKSSKNESEANNRKHMSGVVAGTLTVASAAGLGVLYATSALLTGGISLPIIGGGVAVYSASRFLSFRKVESGGKVLTKELDSLLETATVLGGYTT
jgi:hypothetical protein